MRDSRCKAICFVSHAFGPLARLLILFHLFFRVNFSRLALFPHGASSLRKRLSLNCEVTLPATRSQALAAGAIADWGRRPRWGRCASHAWIFGTF